MEKNTTPGEIVMLPVEKLMPHPLNPRKDLGDLSEIADSIRANGVLQNLTVQRGCYLGSAEAEQIDGATSGILFDAKADGYTILIGHRRCAAAKLAGLTEVPCRIVDIPENEQIQMMCMENMQRSDLTIYEQAIGFQMMMDYGGTLEEVSEKTGFSKATIKRRLQLAKLDMKTLQAVSSRQADMKDYEKLAKIDDLDTRNKVLCEIGTNNFDKKLADALSAQETKQNIADWNALLKKHGIAEYEGEISDLWSNTYENLGYLEGKANEDKLLRAVGERDHSKCCYKFQGRTAYLRAIKEYTEEENAEQAEKARKAEQERVRMHDLGELAKTAFKLRMEFIKNFPLGESKKVAGKVTKWLFLREIVSFITVGMFSGYSAMTSSKERFSELFDVNGGEDRARLIEFVDTHAEKSLLLMAYSLWSDSPAGCHDYSMHYRESPKLKWLYSFLKDIGYRMSDEEVAMLDGSHALYVRYESDVIDTEGDEAECASSEDDDDLDAMLRSKLSELTGED